MPAPLPLDLKRISIEESQAAQHQQTGDCSLSVEFFVVKLFLSIQTLLIGPNQENLKQENSAQIPCPLQRPDFANNRLETGSLDR